ncbi:MAG TPA: rhodanese-like domain-containing protein [Verrucomicrobiae bacterium]|nr:rhodanese-like domain-containing protein [Verrucomicrobiae bacterium]
MNNGQTDNSIGPHELHRRLESGAPAELLDVRTPGEYSTAHVPGARLIPLGDLDAAAYLAQHAAGKTIYVLCQSGQRARKAVEKFRAAGFDGCVAVTGGTQAWMDAGLPVDRGESGTLPLMRQVQITVGFVSAMGAVLALAVDPWFALLPLITGCGLLFAGITGFCGLALLLAKMPWNRAARCQSNSCCEIKN